MGWVAVPPFLSQGELISFTMKQPWCGDWDDVLFNLKSNCIPYFPNFAHWFS